MSNFVTVYYRVFVASEACRALTVFNVHSDDVRVVMC